MNKTILSRSLTIRVVSALIGLFSLLTVSHFFGDFGLSVLCSIVAIIAMEEYSRMVIGTDGKFLKHRIFFIISAVSVFFLTLVSVRWSLPGLALVAILFLSLCLWCHGQKNDIEKLLSQASLGALGLVYTAVFPACVVLILQNPKGVELFFALLVIVFLGDTFAYFGGKTFGKRKIMPLLSPKKTLAGAISGVFGSTLSGVIYFAWIFPETNLPLFYIALLGILCALVAQTGDLFESLLKRVAKVKDSGRLMPGHGGILDRVDGIYFAAPVFTLVLDLGYFFFNQ